MDRDAQSKLVEALRFALDAHGAQTRRGTRIPYASHLLAVAGLVLEQGGDVDQAAAGLLHDVIEDCGHVDGRALRERFGAEVARIVESCSDLLEGDGARDESDWMRRKRRYVERLRQADARARLVAACDKLHNLRALVADLQHAGSGTLARFHATPAQTRWYYHEVRGALGSDLPAPLLAELDALLASLRRLVSIDASEA